MIGDKVPLAVTPVSWLSQRNAVWESTIVNLWEHRGSRPLQFLKHSISFFPVNTFFLKDKVSFLLKFYCLLLAKEPSVLTKQKQQEIY